MRPPFSSRVGTVVEINRQFLIACACGFIAWRIWPDSPEWWGFGLTSILLWLACASAIVNALRRIVGAYEQARVVRDFEAMGGAPKSSELATKKKMKKAGMLHG